jgi:hypothetical protein
MQFVPHRKHTLISTIKTNLVMLFKETMSVYREEYSQHKYILLAECRVLVH